MRRRIVTGGLVLSVVVLGWCALRAGAQPSAGEKPSEASASTEQPDAAAKETPVDAVASTEAPKEDELNLPELREAWRKMTAAEFVQSAAETLKEYADHPEVAPAVAEDAAKRLVDTGEAKDADYEVVFQMFDWSRPNLDDEKRARIRGKLLERADDNGKLSFTAIRDKIALQTQTGVPHNDALPAAIEWLKARDLETLPADQMEWGAMTTSYTPAAAQHYFSVRWTGTIKAPKAGVYTFTPSPLRIRGRSGAARVDSAMRVWIDGTLLFDSATRNPPESIQFAADQARTIRVEFEHKHSNSWIRLQRPAVAMLYWQGPDLERQIVPPDAFTTTTPDGEKPGLLGVYEYRPRGLKPPVTVERIDPNLDFFWTGGYTLQNPDDPEALRLSKELARKIAAKYASPEFLKDAVEKRTYPFANGQRIGELLTSEERKAALETLAGEPELLKTFSPFHARDVYWMFRGGAEPESIRFLGRWMQAREWWWARIHPKFFMHNRKPYFDIADSIAYEYPAGRDVLEKDYLVRPDGSCSLGAAYTLAYAYTFRNQSKAWSNKLNGHIAKTTGNARVPWLLARAQILEIRGHWTYRYRMLPERWDAGEYFLGAALAAAEDEPTRLRVYGEIVARLLANGRANAARRLVAQARPHLPSPESQAELAAWRKAATEISERFAAQRAGQRETAVAAHVAELERRRQKAEERNDSAGAARYGQLIEAAETVPEKAKE